MVHSSVISSVKIVTLRVGEAVKDRLSVAIGPKSEYQRNPFVLPVLVVALNSTSSPRQRNTVSGLEIVTASERTSTVKVACSVQPCISRLATKVVVSTGCTEMV